MAEKAVLENLGVRTGIGLSSDQLIKQLESTENLLGIERLPTHPGTLDALLPRSTMQRGNNKVQLAYTVELEVDELEEAEQISRSQLPQIAINEGTVRRYGAKAMLSDRARYVSKIDLMRFIVTGLEEGFSVAAARGAVDAINLVPLVHGTSSSVVDDSYLADMVRFIGTGNDSTFNRPLTLNVRSGLVVMSRAQVDTYLKSLTNVYVNNGTYQASAPYNSGDEAMRGYLSGLTIQESVRIAYDDNIRLTEGTPSATGIAAFNNGLVKLLAPIEERPYDVTYDAEYGITKVVRQAHWGYASLNPFQAVQLKSSGTR